MYFNPGRKNVLRNGENRSLPRSHCSAASSTRCAPGLDCVANGLSTDSRFNAMSQSDSSAASNFRHFCIQIPEKVSPELRPGFECNIPGFQCSKSAVKYWKRVENKRQ